MAEEEIGVVVKFFSKPSVAAVEITNGSIKVGDTLHFKGHTTDFNDVIESMEIDNNSVSEANSGDMIGIKVSERVREKDAVYKVSD
jgi:translation initiation factor IF-2